MSKKYVPLHCHSHFSLLDGLSKPKDIAQRIETLELEACALTDHGSLSGAVQFSKAMQDKSFKPILGCELYLSPDSLDKTPNNRKLFHQVVLSQSINGWRYLLKAVSEANTKERFYHKARLDFKYLEDNPPKDIITFSGHLGSHLANAAIEGKVKAIREAQYLRDLFGHDNFYIEIQMIDSLVSELAKEVGEILREVSIITGIPCVATADSHYCKKEDAIDHRVLLCSNMNTTFSEINTALAQGEEVGLSAFFKSTNFHIPSYDELRAVNSEEELQNTVEIADRCQNYSILGPPEMPDFECPQGMSQDGHLRQLCREGWRNKLQGKIDENHTNEYILRIKTELEVFSKANLSGYFLVMEDIVRYVKSNGWLVGPGRGSAAGCLVSYLIGITAINPVKHGLMFERFYNAGRNTATRVSYPDIDIDVPVNKRDRVLNYIRQTYGEDKVAQLITFQTMKAKSALKTVLRTHGDVSFYEMNEITAKIADEAKLSAELKQMKEDGKDASCLLWSLEHRVKDFKDWCYLEDGKLQGPLAERFEQAIRLEGTKTAASRHPSGIVVAKETLSNVCPMAFDTKHQNQIVAYEMYDAEAASLVKLDILGLNFLDKMDGISQILKTGDIHAGVVFAD